MHELLTERLAVMGQGRLKTAFSSALAFAVKGAGKIPENRRLVLLTGVEEFARQKDMYFRIRELSLQSENIEIWLQCLADGIYACSLQLQETLRELMKNVMGQPECTLTACWKAYAALYARQLLCLGSQTILNAENGFNLETARFFIENPEKTHGEELINDIPPLLEKGYIYLNRCGYNQQTDWHRYTFMDSYFKALMSYLAMNVLNSDEIRRAFQFPNILSEKC